jgi:hypothetical protein
MSAATSSALPGEGLRERNIAAASKEDGYSPDVSSEDEVLQADDDVEKEKKTFGRTPDGTSEFHKEGRIGVYKKYTAHGDG